MRRPALGDTSVIRNIPRKVDQAVLQLGLFGDGIRLINRRSLLMTILRSVLTCRRVYVASLRFLVHVILVQRQVGDHV